MKSSKRFFSTFKVAKLLGVDPGSVANWIDDGVLKAHRTPGGHRRIQVDDLMTFLTRHKMPIPQELRFQPVRVVVVDDEPDVTQIITRAIRTEHPEYEVYEALDGFQAGTIISTVLPDVVILDLRMPGMDGFETCRMIKANALTKAAEVVVVTAYPSAENEKKILECGARMCLSKPLNLAQLVHQISILVEQQGRA